MRVETEESASGNLYEANRKKYPAAVRGRMRSIKWTVMALALGLYYLLPFVRWDRGPSAPDQAVLIDMAGRKAYFFMIEIWPQEVYYLTGLLVLAAIALFLTSALAGRVWCGYSCPQTVWTDLFFSVERFFEGDRRDRMRLDKAPMGAEKLLRKGGKHLVWLAIALATGLAFTLYFGDAFAMLGEVFTGRASLPVYATTGILTFTTYALAGFMREQVCLYMCPWPRIQAALTDEWALNVTYRADRGEPRLSVKAAERALSVGEKAGDCIDCHACVNVCPTGVDIRDGLQLGCIQCGLCIDACDGVMRKVGRAPGLIGYDTDMNMERREKGLPPLIRLVRPRTVLYAVLIVAIAMAMAYTLMTRATQSVDVLHDRNPLFVNLSDGGVRNGYTVRLANKRPEEHAFALAVEGLPEGARLEAQGVSTEAGRQVAVVGPDTTRELRVLVIVPGGVKLPASTPVTFTIVDAVTGETASRADFFRTGN